MRPVLLTDRDPASTHEDRLLIALSLNAMERARHERMLLLLEDLLDTVRLAPDQARSVCAEIQERRDALKEVARLRKKVDNDLFAFRHAGRVATARPTHRAATATREDSGASSARC